MMFKFIADIRGAARVRELEEKRINKEMANIRKKFKGHQFRLQPWNALTFHRWKPRRISEEKVGDIIDIYLSLIASRYVAKIIFTYILGYKVDVGHMVAVNLISSSKYSEKQIVGTLQYILQPWLIHVIRDIWRSPSLCTKTLIFYGWL
jgi:AP-2 complex subunit alpha